MTTAIFDRLTTLSEPVRVRMLRILAREELAVGEIARVLQTSQPTVSRHLKQLDAGGWVLRRPVGTATYYRVDEAGLPDEARSLWELVHEEVEHEAGGASSQYAEDLRRLDGVVGARAGDSEALFRRLGGRWDGMRRSSSARPSCSPPSPRSSPQHPHRRPRLRHRRVAPCARAGRGAGVRRGPRGGHARSRRRPHRRTTQRNP